MLVTYGQNSPRYTRWETAGADVQAKVVATEAREMAEVASTDKAATSLLTGQGREAMEAFLSNFSIRTADALVDEWVDFFPELFVKYRAVSNRVMGLVTRALVWHTLSTCLELLLS